MAVNINNWKNLDTKGLQSSKLRQEGNKTTKANIRQATKAQVKASVQHNNFKVKLSVNGQKQVAARTPLQHGQLVKRAHTNTFRHSATTQASSKKLQTQNQSYLKSKAAATELKKTISGNQNTSTTTAVNTKSNTADVGPQNKGYTLSQAANGVPAKDKGIAKDAPKAKSANAKSKANKGKAKTDPKLAAKKAVEVNKKSAKTVDAKQVSTAGNAAAAAATKGQVKAKDASNVDTKERSEKKEGKEKKSSLATNKAGATVRDLNNLTAGIQTNVGAGSDSDGEWNTGNESPAISAKKTDAAERTSLMEENPAAVTFNEPSKHDGVWNLHKTFTSKVIQPRLEQIKELHESVTGRLVALKDRLISDPNSDPKLVEMLKKNLNNRSNAYGGISA